MVIIKNLLNNVKNTPFVLGICLSVTISLLFGVIGLTITGLKVDLEVEKLSFMTIFIHNSLANLILLVSVFTFGSLTSLILGANFLFFGIKISAFLSEYDMTLFMQKVIAHGIVELPSIILAGAFGYYLLSKKVMKQSIKLNKAFWFLFLKILFICLLLNLLAAIIEAQVGMRV